MKFLSKYKEHRIVYKHAIVSIVNGFPHRVSGEDILFNQGAYETNDKDKIAFLMAKPYFGFEIWEEKTSGEIKSEAVEAIKNATGIADTVSSPAKTFTCNKCGFEAKSNLGLTAHMKKH